MWRLVIDYWVIYLWRQGLRVAKLAINSQCSCLSFPSASGTGVSTLNTLALSYSEAHPETPACKTRRSVDTSYRYKRRKIEARQKLGGNLDSSLSYTQIVWWPSSRGPMRKGGFHPSRPFCGVSLLRLQFVKWDEVSWHGKDPACIEAHFCVQNVQVCLCAHKINFIT